jgi:hypothetical protein
MQRLIAEMTRIGIEEVDQGRLFPHRSSQGSRNYKGTRDRKQLKLLSTWHCSLLVFRRTYSGGTLLLAYANTRFYCPRIDHLISGQGLTQSQRVTLCNYFISRGKKPASYVHQLLWASRNPGFDSNQLSFA